MRIRSTKPEFWRSKTIAALPWDVRLVLKGMEHYVDDNGVGKDDIALIAADVFPRDLSANPPETLRRLREALTLLSEAGLIARYVIDGEDLLYIDRWAQLQRVEKPSKGRFRRPDGTLEYSEPVTRETYRNPPGTLPPGTGEQRNRGTEEQGLNTPSPRAAPEHARFAQFYDAYPRKMARPRAANAFVKAIKRADADVIIEAAARYAADPNLPDKQFLPYPEKWLNSDGWSNDPCPPPRPINGKPAGGQLAQNTLNLQDPRNQQQPGYRLEIAR